MCGCGSCVKIKCAANMRDAMACLSTSSHPGSGTRRCILQHGPLCPRPLAPSAQGHGAAPGGAPAAAPGKKDCWAPPPPREEVADGIIRVQPKPELKLGALKPLSKEDLGQYAYKCEDCGKCKECTSPRPLPSDWSATSSAFARRRTSLTMGPVCAA